MDAAPTLPEPEKHGTLFEYINEINCFCGWHRFFFGGEDFDVNEKNRRGLKKILREHIKKEHEILDPWFQIRMVKIKTPPFRIREESLFS